MGLLLWYFKRSNDQSDKRLDGLEADLDEVRGVLARKSDKEDLAPIWEKLNTQDRDIKNLASEFSRELRIQIDQLRSESNSHQRQTNDRLDRIIMALNQNKSS